MKEYEVQIWYDEEDGSLGELDELYEHNTLAAALVDYNRRRNMDDFKRTSAYKCPHIILMHYPDYNKSEDGGDGKVIAEDGVE